MNAPDLGVRVDGEIRRRDTAPLHLSLADRARKAAIEARQLRRVGYRVTATDVLEAWSCGADPEHYFRAGGGQ